jgi:hypothetical protein
MKSKKKFSLIVRAALLLFGLFYPIETTVVPAWKLRVIDENGVPYQGLRVVESWKHYSLELEGGTNGEERWTDKDGYVEFPIRTLSMSILGRLVRTALTSIKRYMHGGTGIHAYIMATGPLGTKDINYEPNKPPPDTLVLPRQGTEEKNH